MKILRYVSVALLSVLLVGCEGDARPFEEAVEVRIENLKSIAIVPPKISVDTLIMNIGESVQFGVTGTTVNDRQVTLSNSDRLWRVDNESAATINADGQLLARANGNVGVSIAIGGLESAIYELEVFDANLIALEAIKGEPIIERCLPADYQATGMFDDNSVRDVAGVDWTLASTDAGKARLLNNPDTTVTVTGLNTASVTLNAALSGFNLEQPIEISDSLSALSISPTSASIDVGDTQEFAAFGDFTGPAPGSEDEATSRNLNVTSSVEFQVVSGSDNLSLSNSVDDRVTVEGLSSGSASLRVSCGDLSSPTYDVTVSDSSSSDSSGLSFQRGDPIIMVLGETLVLRVSTGSTYSTANQLDNDDLTWRYADNGSATPAIDLVLDGVNAGLIRSLAIGSGTITVTDADGATASIGVEVGSN